MCRLETSFHSSLFASAWLIQPSRSSVITASQLCGTLKHLGFLLEHVQTTRSSNSDYVVGPMAGMEMERKAWRLSVASGVGLWCWWWGYELSVNIGWYSCYIQSKLPPPLTLSLSLHLLPLSPSLSLVSMYCSSLSCPLPLSFSASFASFPFPSPSLSGSCQLTFLPT